MEAHIEFLIQSCHLRAYLWAAFGLAIFIGLCAAPRYFDNRKTIDWPMRLGETIRCVVWDALVHLIGFLLVPTLLLFALAISHASNSTEKIVLGILFLPLFFYMVFCLSGRGVEVLNRTILSGMKSIDITWRGIKIAFRKPPGQPAKPADRPNHSPAAGSR